MAKGLTKKFMAEYEAARRRTQRAMRERPYAAAASVDSRARMLNVRLLNGCAFLIPVDVIPELRSLSDRDLEKVQVWPGGVGLRWDKQDIDLSVVGLARLALGGTNLLRAAGAAGGSARTPAKAAAARANGRKGGRPRLKKESRVR
jgi:hypothetical protein